MGNSSVKKRKITQPAMMKGGFIPRGPEKHMRALDLGWWDGWIVD